MTIPPKYKITSHMSEKEHTVNTYFILSISINFFIALLIIGNITDQLMCRYGAPAKKRSGATPCYLIFL